MLSPSPRNPLAYLYSRKQDEVYNQQAGQHPLAQFPSTPNGNHAALYTLPVARGHPSRKESGSHLSAKSAIRTSDEEETAGPIVRETRSQEDAIGRHAFLAVGSAIAAAALAEILGT
jgi:hypothetical protein